MDNKLKEWVPCLTNQEAPDKKELDARLDNLGEILDSPDVTARAEAIQLTPKASRPTPSRKELDHRLAELDKKLESLNAKFKAETKPVAFDEKWQAAENKQVEKPGSPARYVDLTPIGWRKNPPVLIFGGWSVGKSSLRETARVLYEDQRRVIIADSSRYEDLRSKDGETKNSLGAKTLNQELHPVIAGQTRALLDIIDDSGIEKIEVLSHSAGALPAVFAAKQHPEHFSKLALSMPAGTFRDSVKELLKRNRSKLGRSLTKDTLDSPRTGLSINLGGLAYILKRPFKSYKEIEAITSTRIRKALEELAEKDVKVAILQANADPLFPPAKIRQNITSLRGQTKINKGKKRRMEPLVDSYSSVIDRRAGHDDLMINPKRTAQAALDILKHM